MGMFGNLPPCEVEKRRLHSIGALKELEALKFSEWYQKRCDSDYWKYGQRCSGCDFWASSEGYTGECQHAGIVSGQDVLRSMGITFSTLLPPPGYPYREASHWCANFKDDFDWSTLPSEYLHEIGAMKDGELREKPIHRDQWTRD